MRYLTVFFFATWLSASAGFAQDQVIATWNINGAERSAEAVGASARGLIAEIGPVDVLILQEVISADQVEAAATAIGLLHWAISDFSPPVGVTNNPFGSLEVAAMRATHRRSGRRWRCLRPPLAGAGRAHLPPRASSPGGAAGAAELSPVSIAPRRVARSLPLLVHGSVSHSIRARTDRRSCRLAWSLFAGSTRWERLQLRTSPQAQRHIRRHSPRFRRPGLSSRRQSSL